MVTLDDIRADAAQRGSDTSEAEATGSIIIMALARHAPAEAFVIACSILAAMADVAGLRPLDVLATCEGVG